MDGHHCAYPSVTVSMDVTVAVTIHDHPRPSMDGHHCAYSSVTVSLPCFPVGEKGLTYVRNTSANHNHQKKLVHMKKQFNSHVCTPWHTASCFYYISRNQTIHQSNTYMLSMPSCMGSAPPPPRTS